MLKLLPSAETGRREGRCEIRGWCDERQEATRTRCVKESADKQRHSSAEGAKPDISNEEAFPSLGDAAKIEEKQQEERKKEEAKRKLRYVFVLLSRGEACVLQRGETATTRGEEKGGQGAVLAREPANKRGDGEENGGNREEGHGEGVGARRSKGEGQRKGDVLVRATTYAQEVM